MRLGVWSICTSRGIANSSHKAKAKDLAIFPSLPTRTVVPIAGHRQRRKGQDSIFERRVPPKTAPVDLDLCIPLLAVSPWTLTTTAAAQYYDATHISSVLHSISAQLAYTRICCSATTTNTYLITLSSEDQLHPSPLVPARPSSLPGAPKLSCSPLQSSETFQQRSSRLIRAVYFETVGRPRPFVIVLRGTQGFAARLPDRTGAKPSYRCDGTLKTYCMHRCFL